MSAITTELETITVTLKRTQVEALRALADDHAVSIDELIANGSNLILMTIEEDEPLFRLIGMVKDGPTDLSERHDEHFAEKIHRVRNPSS